MGKRAPYIRQSDVGAGLTRVSLSFSFFFFFFFLPDYTLSRWLCNNSTKTPYLYRTPPEDEEEEEAKRNLKVCRNKYNFISFSVLLFNTLCVLVSSMWFIGEGGNRFSFWIPIDAIDQRPPTHNSKVYRWEWYSKRREKKEKGTHTGEERERKIFWKQFLAFWDCLSRWSLGCLPRAGAHSFLSWRFDDEGLLHPHFHVL